MQLIRGISIHLAPESALPALTAFLHKEEAASQQNVITSRILCYAYVYILYLVLFGEVSSTEMGKALYTDFSNLKVQLFTDPIH